MLKGAKEERMELCLVLIVFLLHFGNVTSFCQRYWRTLTIYCASLVKCWRSSERDLVSLTPLSPGWRYLTAGPQAKAAWLVASSFQTLGDWGCWREVLSSGPLKNLRRSELSRSPLRFGWRTQFHLNFLSFSLNLRDWRLVYHCWSI